MDLHQAEVSSEVRPGKAAAGEGKGGKRPQRIQHTGVEAKAQEPTPTSPAPTEVRTIYIFEKRDDTKAVNHFQISFHNNVSVYVPGSCVIEKQLDVYAHESQGHYTRPRILNDAVSLMIKEDGGFELYWPNGMRSVVNGSAVASYQIE